MRDVLQAILTRTDAGEAVALCLVVRTRGSTPQKAGAAMLVLQNGKSLGTLGGGCVEAEVTRRATELLLTGDDGLLSFKLDHDYGWDDGLVCGGVMDIAVQVIDSPTDAEPWRAAAQAATEGRQTTVAIAVADDRGQVHHFDHTVNPQPSLVIAGGGHVGSALAQLAASLDFAVTVVDDRTDYASPQRLPQARCVVGAIDLELARLVVHEQTYVVIVTRGHRHDAQALEAVIRTPARYIGLIGSRRKIVTILENLCQRGVEHDQIARVHAPIGLGIGAVTPHEIAVSIAAELIAVRRGADTASLGSLKLDPAHLDRLLNTR
jgi:xanthine dehydrogenase accessory factor